MAADDRQRFQRSLDALDAAAPPRIEATFGCADGLKAVAVLDSSFNPPTRAHLHMLSCAARQFSLDRTMLLLAKQNADKPVVGASLVQRIEMMQAIAAAATPAGSMVCGLTAHPLFVDKAAALQAFCEPGARVAMLVGFDTWIRITDARYYAEGGLEVALRNIFEAVEVVVASRDPGSASNLGGEMSVEEQERVVRQLPEEITRSRLHFMFNAPEMAELSSSALRKAVAAGDGGTAKAMLPECLHAYIDQEGLYAGDSSL